MRGVATALLTVIMAVALATAGAATGRHALVIGNGAYEATTKLANPGNDARAVAEKLQSLGFETTLLLDTEGGETIKRLSEFNRSIRGAEVALFYFAGHGVQIGNRSFLLPTDVSVESEEELRYTAIDAGWIVREMEERAEVSLVILDACRDNPFPEMITARDRAATVLRGLGIIPLSGKGAIVAYAAAAGRVADDGDGQHSPYTKALLAEIDAPGVEVGLMLRRVAGRVIRATEGTQRPELLVRLIDEVYLQPAASQLPVLGAVDTETPVRVGPEEDAPAETELAAAETPASEEEATEPVVEAPVAPDSDTTEPDPETVVAQLEPSNGRSTGGRRFFGERLVTPPDWFEDLAVPPATGWTSKPATTITEDIPGTSFSTALRLPLAARVETRVAERSQDLWYRVDVPTAGEITVSVLEPPAEVDLYARVYDANRDVVANWQGAAGAGKALEGVYPVPGPGRYWIEMTDGSSDAASPDRFAIDVDFRPADDPLEPNPNIGRATPVPSSVLVRPTIFPRGDADWLTFWVDRPGLFTAEASDVPDNIDVAMRVWNFDGDVVRNWAVPARAGGDTFLDAGLKAPGQYFLEVKDSSSDAASVTPFSLMLDFLPVQDDMEPNDSFGVASHQPATGTHDIAIFPRGDTDWIAVDVDHPGQLWLLATEVPKNLDVYMRVWNADKSVLRNWFGPARPGGDTEDFADLPRAGRYFIEIVDGSSDASSEESFELSMAFTPQPDQYEPNNGYADAKPLTPGGEILFNILPRGDRDVFRITVPSMGELSAVIDPSPENLDLHYRVYNANRDVIRNWVAPYRKGGATEGFADLPTPGDYFLEITDGSSDDRSIEHAVLKTIFTPTDDPLEPNNSFGTAQVLPLGETHRAYILPRGDRDWLKLLIDRPGSLEVSVEEVDPELDIVFRLWTADGKAGGWFSPSRKGAPTFGEIPVTEPGVYILEVADSGSDARSANGFTITATLK